ncbi:MAG: hypothetical protein SPL30_05185 [Succinivibrio sp.]|jgi:hypothetical protein|nr:hypothetical protein [Succinivibrio sp.]
MPVSSDVNAPKQFDDFEVAVIIRAFVPFGCKNALTGRIIASCFFKERAAKAEIQKNQNLKTNFLRS